MGVLTDIMTGGAGKGISGAIGAISKKRSKARPATGTIGPPSLAPHDDSGGEEMASYKRGGKVRKTGPARLHKGEQVLTASQARKYRRAKGKR